MKTDEEKLNCIKSIRFYYNGLKINKEKNLYKTYYEHWNKENELNFTPEGWAWNDDLSILYQYKNLLLCPITKDNPLFPYFYNATIKQAIHSLKRKLNSYRKTYAKTASKLYKDYIYETEEEISEWEKRLNLKYEEADEKTMEKYRRYVKEKNQEIEEEKRREEKEEYQKRLNAYNKKISFKKLAKKLMRKYPIKNNEYSVELEWSESPAIDENMKMSLKAADRYLGFLDMVQHKYRGDGNKFTGWGWYDKTSFKIINEKGETEYTGRYDIGDGDYYNKKYGLISHIACHATGIIEYNKKNPETLYSNVNGQEILEYAGKLYQLCYSNEEVT